MELRGDDEIWFDAEEADRYAELADEHVRAGRVAHYVLVDSDDLATLDRWHGLAFGRQQVYAARPFGPAEPYDGPVRVRPGTLDDALALGNLIVEHLAGPPVWSNVRPHTTDALRESWGEFLAEAGTTYLVGELDGRRVAHLALGEDTYLHVGATVAEARGRGAMRALWAAAQERAAERGWATCETDWRSTNVEAAACWQALGFRPTRYRLHRLVGR